MITVGTDNSSKAEFPYLVDICITHKCNYGCSFCYAGSTPDGQEAENYYVTGELKKALEEANVFEVVFGGGEPTTHKSLVYILKSYNDAGFKTSFTTKNYDMHTMDSVKELIMAAGSIAVSVNSLEEFEKAKVMIKAISDMAINHPKGYSHPHFAIQTIMGMMAWSDLQTIITDCSKSFIFNRLSLLGYKSNVGRSAEAPPYEIPDEWIQTVKDSRIEVCLDSIACRTWAEKLRKHGVANYLMSTDEGQETCFIDAVDRVIKPSSFSSVSFSMVKDQDIKEAFAQF